MICTRCQSTEVKSTLTGDREEVRCADCGLFLAAPLTELGRAGREAASRMATIIAEGAPARSKHR